MNTSGTAMFTFAMVIGVKNGLLDEATYGPAARKAWLALVGYLDVKSNLREVCIGTNKASAGNTTTTDAAWSAIYTASHRCYGPPAR